MNDETSRFVEPGLARRIRPTFTVILAVEAVLALIVCVPLYVLGIVPSPVFEAMAVGWSIIHYPAVLAVASTVQYTDMPLAEFFVAALVQDTLFAFLLSLGIVRIRQVRASRPVM